MEILSAIYDHCMSYLREETDEYRGFPHSYPNRSDVLVRTRMETVFSPLLIVFQCLQLDLFTLDYQTHNFEHSFYFSKLY